MSIEIMSCAHATFELACLSIECMMYRTKVHFLLLLCSTIPLTRYHAFCLKDMMAWRPADPEELRWMSQEVRGYV